MDYEQICYSWLHGRDYKGSAPDGWGIAAASNTDAAFLKSAVNLMTNRQAAPSGAVTEYFEYSEAFRRFVYLGVRKIPPLPQMGGGDNNRLMHLYVPLSESDVLSGPEYTDYFDAVPEQEQRGLLGRAEFDCKTYDYQELLKKYGFHREQGEEAVNRFAVLLSLLYLSFYSDEWKQLIFPLGEQNPEEQYPYTTAREITWLLHSLVPEKIFGKTKSDLIHGLGYVVAENIEGYQLTFVRGKSGRSSLKEHVYDLNRAYDAQTVIGKEEMDRKVSGAAELFLALSKKAQESPEAAGAFMKEIQQTARGTVDDILELNRAYHSDYIPYKLYGGMSRELYGCSTLEGLLELSENHREILPEGIARYRSCNPGTGTALYLAGGAEVLRLLADAEADAAVCGRVLEKYEEADRFAGILPELPVEERAEAHVIFESLKDFLWGKDSHGDTQGESVSMDSEEGDVFSGKGESVGEEDCIENSNCMENPEETLSAKSEEGSYSIKNDHSDTAARMDALSGNNKKKGNFLLKFLKKKD